MTSEEQTFYSNGKLLMTGEYVVLDGAKALALPTKTGQSLTAFPSETKNIVWTAFDSDQSIWLQEKIDFESIISFSGPATTALQRLTVLLHEAWRMSPSFIETHGWKIETKLTFPRKWGLGTSSTLINNLAQWLGIDPYDLLARGFGGSGYDIACAQNNHPIKYHLGDNRPAVERSIFNPPFAASMYFVYLNRKQSSRDAIESYRRNPPKEIGAAVRDISELTNQIESAVNIAEFCSAIVQHEQIIGTLIGQMPIQRRLFADFSGTIKSLGAWGGDFILAVANEDPTDYFQKRGYDTIIPFDAMILK